MRGCTSTISSKQYILMIMREGYENYHQREKLMVDLLSKSFNLFFKEMYGDQNGEFVCRY